MEQQAQQQQLQINAQLEQAKLEQEDKLNQRDNETKLLIANMQQANDGIQEPEYSQEAKDKLAEQIRQFNEKLKLDNEKFQHEKRVSQEELRLKEKQINNRTNVKK